MTWHDQFGLDVTGQMALALYQQVGWSMCLMI